MTLTFTKILVKDKSMNDFKNSFTKHKLKLLSASYGVWVVISLIFTYLQSNKYASYFTDLPAYLKSLPPFVLSLAYLTIFIPVIALAVIYAIYILYFIIRNTFNKNKLKNHS